MRDVVWKPLRFVCPVRCDEGGRRVIRSFYSLNPETIGEPLRWDERRAVTVEGDVFGRFVTIHETAAVFAVMASCGFHQFHLKTEEPEIMRRWFAWVALGGASAVAVYLAGHEVHYPPLTGTAPPTPELRFVYDVGAPRVNPHLRGRAAKRGAMGEFHWRPWPLGNVVIEQVQRADGDRS